MSGKVWEYKNKNIPADAVGNMAKEYSIPPLIALLLMNRGIKTQNSVNAFLTKSLKYVHSPALLPDIDKASERIMQAVKNGEKTVIYGDYDVDGITSTVLMYSFLKSLGAQVEYYIPARSEEGYGINIMAVNRLIKQGVKLLISVDCGITAVGEVEFARLQGMDVIITDHHTCQEKLPRAVAVVNPKIPDCGYPFTALAGVGVVLKVMLACVMREGLNTNEFFNKYAYLAAIGTVADVVSLTDENRLIVSKGLSQLGENKNPGIAALLESAGLDGKPVTGTTIAFGIAPRLNACGRLGSAATAVELLLTDNVDEAKRIASQLEEQNRERKATEQQIYEQALALIEADPELEKKKVIVAGADGWHSGVIGIAASKICERYSKPCILITYDENGTGKGSGRSVPAFDLFSALSFCSSELISFGGHSGAAGVNIKKGSQQSFSEKINKYADSVLSDEDMLPRINIDCELSAAAANIENARYIQKLEPFGEGNETPVFSMHDVKAVFASAIGAEGRHLRLQVKKDGTVFSCIGFNMGELAGRIQPEQSMDIAFNLDINNFRGDENVQFKIRDIAGI